MENVSIEDERFVCLSAFKQPFHILLWMFYLYFFNKFTRKWEHTQQMLKMQHKRVSAFLNLWYTKIDVLSFASYGWIVRLLTTTTTTTADAADE